MRRYLAVVVMVAAGAASCDGGASPTTGVTPSDGAVSTTVSDPDRCQRLADEAVELVADIVDRLGETDVTELTDTEAWGEDLVALRERGTALDAEAVSSGCSAGAIQAAVRVSLGELEADGGLAELLLTLLAPGGQH